MTSPALSSASETSLSRAIQKLLRASGYLVVRVQAGGQHGRMRLAEAGVPDLWCSIGGGMWIEVKRPGQKPSKAQREWHAKAREHGVRVEVVTSVLDVVKLIREERGR